MKLYIESIEGSTYLASVGEQEQKLSSARS
jgi:hypothetical protein